MLKVIITLIQMFLITGIFAQVTSDINELSLQEAIAAAIKNNPEVKLAESEITASKGRYLGNFFLEPPKVSFSYEAVPTGRPLKYFGERYIEVSQSFDDPFGIYFKSKSLSKQTDAAVYNYDQTVLQVTVQVKRLYYQTLAGSEKIKIQERNSELMRDFLQKSEARLNVGEGTNLEFLTAKVEYNEARNFLEQSRNNYKNILNDLAMVLGLDDGAQLEKVKLTDSLNSPVLDLNIGDLISAAGQNPAILSASLNVTRSAYDKKLAWTKLLPSFDLAYFRETIEDNPNFYGVSLGISIPLWFMFNERGNIQEAAANQKSAEYELRSKQLGIYTRIKNAFNNYSNEKNQLNTYNREILPLAEEVYRTAKTSYDAGEISYIEFLQAQQTLISAKNNFIDVLLNHNLALIAIEEAAGKPVNMEN